MVALHVLDLECAALDELEFVLPHHRTELTLCDKDSFRILCNLAKEAIEDVKRNLVNYLFGEELRP